MRPLFAMTIAIVILGGLKLYMTHRPQAAPGAVAYHEITAPGDFFLQLTLTFDAGPDAFALNPATAPSLLIQRNGQDLLRRTDHVAAFEPIEIRPLVDVVRGVNEFFVQATPTAVDPGASRSVRVRMFQDEAAIGDATLWSEPGEPVQGIVRVVVGQTSTGGP